MLAGNVRAAEPADAQADDAESTDLRNYRFVTDKYPEVLEREGANSPNAVAYRIQLDNMRKRLLSRAEMRRHSARVELDEIDQELYSVQSQLRQVTGRTDVSPDSLESAVEWLEKDKEALTLEDAAAQARRDAIESAVLNQTTQARASIKDDAASIEIQKEIDALEQRLKFLEDAAKSGLNTPADVLAAQASLADAQTKLAERRSAVSAEAGGSLLTELNGELVDTTIAEKERRAKLNFIDQRLHTLGDALVIIDDKDPKNLLRRKAAAEIEFDSAERNLVAIQNEVSSLPTTQPAQ
jgi:hypothetical protein